MPQHPNTPTRRRSKAWIYYGLIAVLGLVAAPGTSGASLLVTLIAGAYAVYIYGGGRYVIWIW